MLQFLGVAIRAIAVFAIGLLWSLHRCTMLSAWRYSNTEESDCDHGWSHSWDHNIEFLDGT